MISFISSPQNIALLGNDIIISVQSDYYDDSSLSNVKVYLTVTLSSSTFCRLEATPDAEGVATFNLIDLLNSQIAVDDFLEDDVYKLLSLPQFGIATYETGWTETAMQTSDTVTGNSFRVIQGGIAKKILPFATSGLLNYFCSNRSFLSWQSSKQYVCNGQIVKLYYFHNSTIPGKKLRINIDGVISYIVLTLSNYQLYQFDISQYFEGANIVKVAICATDNFQENEEITYIIDRNYYKRPQTFVFRNSFGVYESVFAKGKQLTTTEFQREINAKGQTTPSNSDGDLFTKRLGLSENIETELGFSDESNNEQIVDFLNSDKVFLLKSGILTPITILSEKITPQNDENNNLLAIKIEWKYNYNERFVGKTFAVQGEKPLLVDSSTYLLINENRYFSWGS